jgi:erythronate-4-phosphate dehydrogenase
MKIVADKEIPYLKGLLEPVAEVVYLPANSICREDLLDADALLIRTRTKCNMELLEGTKVKFIGTMAIGYDHIDANYCEVKNITWVNAPGCNSRAVAQYVTSSILSLAEKYGFDPSEKTLGIIGVGQVGQKVERNARLLGMKILLYDPPRARNEGEKNFNTLENILEESDIITFHPTLEREGPDKTWHMADESFFSRLKKPVFIINTSRGGVIDTLALKKAINEKQIIDCAIDCWENEPDIDKDLVKKCHIATPHIAGYSFDGKANATRSVLEQLNSFFQLNLPRVAPELPIPESPVLKIPGKSGNKVASALLHSYNPLTDTKKLKSSPEKFESIRNKYVFRREYKAFTVMNLNEKECELLKAFGFQVTPYINDRHRKQ